MTNSLWPPTPTAYRKLTLCFFGATQLLEAASIPYSSYRQSAGHRCKPSSTWEAATATIGKAGVVLHTENVPQHFLVLALALAAIALPRYGQGL